MAEMDNLRFFGLDGRQIEVLENTYGKELLPLQERALKEGLLLDGAGLVVAAPTSSGKTLLAELAFLAEAKRDRPVILLVPSKALATERFTDLSRRYEPLGYRICLSTRDHSSTDRMIAQGTYHLAVLVYEKMRVLLQRHPGMIAAVKLIVVDELQHISDLERGPALELMLTRLRRWGALRFLGLSAVSEAARFAGWLGCRTLVHDDRPVELRQGVLCGREFFYREHNSGQEGRETLPLPEVADEGELILEAARYFAGQGESSIVFQASRAECYAAARRLIRSETEQPTQEIPEDLLNLPKTRIRDFLSELISFGVAVHTSDLSPEERDVVERLARAGKLKIVCATSTLAEGVNLPAHNVLTSRCAYRSARPGARPDICRLDAGRFLNMIGRAGRLGFARLGRGMVVTTLEGDVDGLLDRYLHQPRYDLNSALPKRPLSGILLEAIACGDAETREELAVWLSETYAGHENSWPEQLPRDVRRAIDELKHEGHIEEIGGRLSVSNLAGTVARFGVAQATVRTLMTALEDIIETNPNERLLLFALAGTEELRTVFVPVRRREWAQRVWSRILCEERVPDRLLQFTGDIQDRERAAKKALILSAWYEGRPVAEIEERFAVLGGTVRNLADQAVWLIELCLELPMDLPAHVSEWLDRLRRCLAFGLPNAALGWASVLAGGFPREYALALFAMGAEVPKQVAELTRSEVESEVPQAWLERLPVQADSTCAVACGSELQLSIDFGRPDRVVLNGTAIPVSKKQFQLLSFMGCKPGVCFSYDALLDRVWEGVVVEQSQIPKLKSLICKRARAAIGQPGDKLLRTVPGRGLVLEAKTKFVSNSAA